jgi:predicted metal-binding membrane protein
VPVDATLEALVRRDRKVVIVAVTTVVALSWGYLLVGAGMGTSALEMTRMSHLGISGRIAGGPMMTPASGTLGYAVLMFFMWWIMMVAMMLPSAAPMVDRLVKQGMSREEARLRGGVCWT